MRTYRTILRIDFAIQVLLVGFPIIAIPLGFILSIGELIVMGMLDLLLIGAWQLLSGLVLAIGYQDKLRMKYLIFSGLYLLVGFFIPYYLSMNTDGSFWILGFASYFIALWYFFITHRDLQEAKNQMVSFWDLKA